MTGDGPAVLIMARAPRAGSVKTRLQPLLGAAGCARLQAALTERAVRRAGQFAPGRSYLALDPLDPAALSSAAGVVRLLGQHGDNLGARMRHAVHEVRAEQHGPVVVIGTDAPTLREPHLRAAASALDDGADVVFGPALDGGYYLIALRNPIDTDIVFGIDASLWGGPGVLAASLARARAAGLRTVLLTPLRDLDTPADARALVDEGELPEDIADLLAATVAS